LATSKTSKEPADLEPFVYPKLDEELFEVLQEEFEEHGDIGISMPTVKVPSGGGMAFDLPDEEVSKTIDCVIVNWHEMNLLWINQYDGSKNPPDCVSNDGKEGEGYPGGNCKACGYNQFSADGGGKSCKNIVRAYILVPGQIMPWVLNIPPSSLRAFHTYRKAMLLKAKPLYMIRTQIGLEKQDSKGGIVYSGLTFKMVDVIDPSQKVAAKEYTGSVKGLARMSAPPALSGGEPMSSLPPGHPTGNTQGNFDDEPF